MNTLTRDDINRQKAGGAAALYIAIALLAAMPYFLIVVDYMGATTAAQKVALVVANHTSMHAMYFVTYVFYGLALGVLAFALHDRLVSHASATMRFATAVGLLWSVALIMSGMVFTYGMTTVVALAESDPARAAQAWQSIEAVAQALGGAGGEVLGGLWLLLVSTVALRGRALPRPLGWFGIAISAMGIASAVPPLHDAAIAFGMLLIPWFAWTGVCLLATKPTLAESAQPADGAAVNMPATPTELVGPAAS